MDYPFLSSDSLCYSLVDVRPRHVYGCTEHVSL